MSWLSKLLGGQSQVPDDQSEDSKVLRIKRLAQKDPTSPDELKPVFVTLETMARDPSARVRLAVCEAIVRYVLLHNQFDSENGEQATKRGLGLLKPMEEDVEPVVWQLAQSASRTLRMNWAVNAPPVIANVGSQAVQQKPQRLETYDEMFERLVLSNAEIQDDIERLANEPSASFEELCTIVGILGELIANPAPDVQVNVCRAIVRCVKLSSRFGDHARDQMRQYALLLLEGIEGDSDLRVRSYVAAAQLTMDMLQEERT